MKLITIFVLFIISFGTCCYAQKSDFILQKYLEKIKAIDIASYDIQRIDTFTTGDAWNNKGKCIIRRNSQDRLLGFEFFGVRSDVNEECLYDGTTYFEIDRKNKKYKARSLPSKGILGSTGGQMVVEELMNADTAATFTNYTKSKNTYILKFKYPDNPEYNVTNHYKLIYLDVKTYLPKKTATYLTSLGKRQVSIELLSNLKINDQAGSEKAFNKDFLINYSQELPAKQNQLEQLLDQEAYSFVLRDFNNRLVDLNSYKGKIVLLDFWEVWCGPCIQAMPKLQSIYEKYQKEGLVVLGIISNKKSVASAKLLAQKKKVTFANLIGDDLVTRKYSVSAVPEYILIDEKGKIIYAAAGYSEKLDAILKAKFKH